MPVEYKWDKNTRLMCTRFWGIVTNDDLQQHIQKIQNDTDLQQPLYELVYTSDVTDVQITDKGLRMMVMEILAKPDHFAGQRTAVIAATDLNYGMSNMYANLSSANDSPITIQVFRTEEEAREWLLNGQ